MLHLEVRFGSLVLAKATASITHNALSELRMRMARTDRASELYRQLSEVVQVLEHQQHITIQADPEQLLAAILTLETMAPELSESVMAGLRERWNK